MKKFDLVAQLVEHNTFNVGVLGSSPSGITELVIFPTATLMPFTYVLYSARLNKYYVGACIDLLSNEQGMTEG